ncbi:Protein of unknown function [Pyronema omphalodes CBS 100304]|uniref:Uncharacterized protein n=1 Tax=Pyronema omphalodes (strain CBS 100304) TaxID=1076935 RepID=U4L595_PYROM|nr:Protein of unknown function [Pyronema omphalodes CBS 100304]
MSTPKPGVGNVLHPKINLGALQAWQYDMNSDIW